MTASAIPVQPALRRPHSPTRRARLGNSSRPFTPIAVFAAFMVMVVTGRLHDALLYGKLPVVKIFLVIGVVLFFMSRGIPVVSQALRTLPARGFVALTAAVIVSVPFSVLKGWSFQLATNWIFASVPMVILVATSIRTIADMERMLKALVLMVIVSAAIILAGLGTAMESPEGPRLSLAGSYDPNDFAAVIAASSAASLWALRGRSWLWKILGGVALVCSGVIVVKTGSRGGAVALGGLLVGSALFLPGMMTKTTRLVVIAGLVAGAAYAPSGFVQRMSTLTDVKSDYNFTENSGRIAVWTRGLGYIARSPIVGVGVGAYSKADGNWAIEHGYVRGFKWSVAHNLFIETAAEIGLPGLAALLCCLLPIVFTWLKVRRIPVRSADGERLKSAIQTVALATLTYLLATMFINALTGPMLLTLISLSIAAHMLLSQMRSAGRPGNSAASNASEVRLPNAQPRRTPK